MDSVSAYVLCFHTLAASSGWNETPLITIETWNTYVKPVTFVGLCSSQGSTSLLLTDLDPRIWKQMHSHVNTIQILNPSLLRPSYLKPWQSVPSSGLLTINSSKPPPINLLCQKVLRGEPTFLPSGHLCSQQNPLANTTVGPPWPRASPDSLRVAHPVPSPTTQSTTSWIPGATTHTTTSLVSPQYWQTDVPSSDSHTCVFVVDRFFKSC